MAKQIKETQIMNNIIYINYYNRLKNLAVNMYEWENVPAEIDVRFIEETLFEKGELIFYKSKITQGYVCLPGVVAGGINMYGRPLGYTVYSVNGGFSETISADECVVIRNNDLSIATSNTIELFANTLYEAHRTAEINVRAQKNPIIMKGTEAQRLSMKNLWKQFDGNEPAIFVDKESEDIDCIDLRAPFLADKITDWKGTVWAEALTFLGINNANTDKRERLIVDEVNANNEHKDLSQWCMLNAREKAVKEINAKFGLNISVGYIFENQQEYLATPKGDVQNG